MHHSNLMAGRNFSGISNNAGLNKIKESNPHQSIGQRFSSDTSVEEPISRYNIALQKVVKRYLKVNVLFNKDKNSHDGEH